MKKIIFILLVFMSLTSFAQIGVKDSTFRKIGEMCLMDDDEMYAEGYALIEISTENIKKNLRYDFEFTSDLWDIEKEIKKKTININVDENTKSILISHLLYGDVEFVFPEKLCANCIYAMTVVYEEEKEEPETVEEEIIDTLQNLLTINSYPHKSNVYIDEEYKGHTPLVLSGLSTGKYDVRVEKKNYLSKDTAFFITRNDTLLLTVDSLQHVDDFAFQNFELGKRYYFGDSLMQQDYAKAMEHFQISFDYGYEAASFYMAECYYNGNGVEQDYDQSVIWYTTAAEFGMADAQMVLAYSYYNGIGVVEDKSEAVKWYKKAAKQDVAVAQNILGYCYHDGVGVKQNKSTAMKWYAKSAELGNADAQNTMGLF